MLKIALTGGIGSGKSTVAARMAELGATVIDADQIAREVVALGTPGLAAVVRRFSADVLADDGSLDRPKLGRLVFADESALADLNTIVHPLVAARTAELIEQADPESVIVYDVPLLAENHLEAEYDAVVVVEAPIEVRLQRLAGRGLPPAEARARMARQATDEQRRALATVVLDNAGTKVELISQVDAVWRKMVAR